MRSPSSSSSAVFLRGRLRASSALIMNGKIPTFISGAPKVARSEASTRSQASARPSAPARQWPSTAHSTGLPSSPISVNSAGNLAVVSRCLRTSGTSAVKPARSPPALNVVSCVLASTTQRADSSARAASKASISSSSTAPDSALRVSGWSRAIVATPSPATA